MRRRWTVPFAAWCLIAAIPAPAAAQTLCPEGRTLTGDCVNPGLAQAMRGRAIAFAQPKISYTAPPWLPSQDRGYYITRDHHEMSNLFGRPPMAPFVTYFRVTRP
jgi:hypothetical protein